VKLLAVLANDELAEANHGELVVRIDLLQAIFSQDKMPLVKYCSSHVSLLTSMECSILLRTCCKCIVPNQLQLFSQ
jgi:hypothetical protein